MVVQNSLPDLVCSPLKSDKKHRLKQRFDIKRKLGQGTYGKVQLAINRETGQEVAVKTIKKEKIENEQGLLRIRREIQIMSSIQHPYIIHIYDVFENKDKIVLVMQFACGGELYNYLSEKKVLSDVEARRIFRQIAAAVYYCHKNKICHRDLKLENILLDEKGNAKIADFGLSNVFYDKNLLNTFCGSPLYASPEIVQGVPYYGPEVDCWSMGVLLYTLVYGAMPFDGSNFKKLVTQISEGDYFEPKKKSSASGLIRKLLTVNPMKRATIEDICEDEWVNTGYEHSLLQVAMDMADLTPVRLDLLLALTPGADSLLEDVASAQQLEDTEVISNKTHEPEVEDDDDDNATDTAAGSFAFVKGSRASQLSISSPNLQQVVDEYEEDSEDDFLSADVASAMEGDSGKRLAESSFGTSLARISSLAHHSKKAKKSPSSLVTSNSDVKKLAPQETEKEAMAASGNKGTAANFPRETQVTDNQCPEAKITHVDKNPTRDIVKTPPPANLPSEIEQQKLLVKRESKSTSKVPESSFITQRKESLTVLDEKSDVKKGGRPPGKIVIPKTFDSSQSTPSPKPTTAKTLIKSDSRTSSEDSVSKKAPSSPVESENKNCKTATQADVKADETNVKNVSVTESTNEGSITEQQKVLAKDILKKGIAKAKLAERKMSREKSLDSEVPSGCSTPAAGVSDPKPSFFKTPKPFVKEEESITSSAEIKLSSTQSTASTVKNEPSRAPLWDSGKVSPDKNLPERNNSNWSAISSTIDSEMSSWREQMEESLRRLSPEDERSSNPSYALSKLEDDKPLVPIARSYKKFTFTKDGACITETKKIYTTPGADGSWTKVEKKTKITTRPGNAEEFEKFRDMHLKNESASITRSDSQSSSGSNDVYDDIFDSWTGDKMVCNMKRMNNMFQAFSRDPFMHKEKRRNPLRFFRRTESERNERDKLFDLQNNRDYLETTDLDNNVNDSGAVVYGSPGLWQFLRSSNVVPSRVSIQQEPIVYGRSISQDRSKSRVESDWKRCNSRASSGYNTGNRSQSRDRTQSPREKVLRFVFESPREGFSRDPSVQEFPLMHERWSMKRSPTRRRDSGVGSDGYESEYSVKPSPSDEMSRTGRVSSLSSVHNGSKHDMIKNFMKSWSKEFMSPSSFENCKDNLENLSDTRKNRVEQWLHRNSDLDNDGAHSGILSKKSAFSHPPAYATMRPREYFQYGRSSSDKLAEYSDFFDDSCRRRTQSLKKDSPVEAGRMHYRTYSPLSEESLKDIHSAHSDSSHGGSSVHHINFTISDGRVASSHTPPPTKYVRHFSTAKDGCVMVESPPPTSVRFERTSSMSPTHPVVQMRVSINRNSPAVEVHTQPSQGLWDQQGSLHAPRKECVINLNRSPSPVPGIRQFSTEVQHSVGGSDCLPPKSPDCESNGDFKNTGKCSPKSFQPPTESSIWNLACSNKCMESCSELTNTNKTLQLSGCCKRTAACKTFQPPSKHLVVNADSSSVNSPIISNGDNTPDSLEDLSAEQSMTSDSLVTTNNEDFPSDSIDSPVEAENDACRVKVKPLGVLWQSCNPQPVKFIKSEMHGLSQVQNATSCSIFSDMSENVDRQKRCLENTTSEIGSIWNQKNAYQTFDFLKNLLSDDGLDSFSSTKCLNSSHLRTNPKCSNENNLQQEPVDQQFSVIDNIELERLAESGTFRKISLMDDLQSPKEVLRQAMKICDSFEQIG